MFNSFYILCQICVFSAKPQDLPASRSFLIGVIITNIIVFLVGYNVLPVKVNPFILTAVQLLLTGIFWYVILQLGKKVDRWDQSASALFGISTILSVISFPILISNKDMLSGEPPETVSPALFSIFLIRIWELIVISTIVRETLETKNGVAYAISLGMTISMEIILKSFLGLAE